MIGRPLRGRAVAAASVALMLATGCSGGAPRSAPRPTVPLPTVPLPASAAPSTTALRGTTQPASNGTVSAANLRAGDFPAGWTVTPAPPTTPGNDPAATDLLTCLHLDPKARTVVAEVASPGFSLGQAVQASSDVTTLTSPATAAQEVTALRASGGLSCLGRVIGEAVASQGIGVTGATIRELPSAPTGTFPSVAVSYQATFTHAEQSLPAATDEYFIARGNQEVTVTFSGYGAPFPAAIEAAAMAKLTARL